MSLLLPWEAIERVIDHSFDSVVTLYNFALTCRDLNPRSTIILLGHVSFKNRQQIFSFCAVLNAKPHLRHAVQSMTVPPNEFSPWPLLSLLDNLSKIEFTPHAASRHHSESKNPDTVMHPSISTFCRLSGVHIQSLSLQHMSFSSLSAFSRLLLLFPRIKSLRCSNLNISNDHSELELVTRRLSRRMHLETLAIGFQGTSYGMLRLLGEVAKRTVKRLELWDLDWGMYQQMKPEHWIIPAEVAVNVDHPLHSNMHEIKNHPSYIFLRPLLSGWVELTSLTLRIPRIGMDITTPIDQVVLTLNYLRRPTNLREVIVDFSNPEIKDILHFLLSASLTKIPELERMLLNFPQPKIQFIPRNPINFRSTHFWRRRIEEFFPALAKRGAVTLEAKYSGKVGHDSEVIMIATSADGRWAATGSEDNTIIIWDLSSESLSQEWLAPTDRPMRDITSLDFSPDGRYLASTGPTPGVTVWDLHRNACKVVTLGLAFDHGTACPCAWSSNGAFLAADVDDNMVHTWQASTFQRLHPHETWTGKLLALSPDGRWVLTQLSEVGNLWNATSGTLHAKLQGHIGDVVDAAFNSNSTRVATVAEMPDSTIRIWDVRTGHNTLIFATPPESDNGWWVGPQNVVYSPDGRLVLSLLPGLNRSLTHVWDAYNGALLIVSSRIFVQSRFSPCSRYVASISPDEGSVVLWWTSDGSCIAEISGDGSAVKRIAITPDGRLLCCGCQDGTMFFRQLSHLVPAAQV